MEKMEIDTESILNRFKDKKGNVKINYGQTLFEPKTEDINKALKAHKCPRCFNKLYEMRNGAYHCRSKKHKGYFITKAEFEYRTK